MYILQSMIYFRFSYSGYPTTSVDGTTMTKMMSKSEIIFQI